MKPKYTRDGYTHPLTIRFVDYINGDWVTLELKDGQCIEHCRFERHDEGYTRTFSSYERLGDSIARHIHISASDCDGPIEHFYRDYAYPLNDGYRTIVDWEDKVQTTKGLHWQDSKHTIRDHWAEEAGY